MTYKDKIIKFMKKKQEIITGFHSVYENMYFNNEDKALINEWEESTCERIWNMLIYYIRVEKEYGLYTNMCPFCHYYTYESDTTKRRLCTQCAYAYNHNMYNKNAACSKDWALITMNGNVHNLFTNDVYHEIIRDIESND